jgi:putative transposase
MKNDYVSSGRSVSDMKAHLVLTTKYRRKAFTGEMLKRLQEILFDLCQKWDCKLIEFNGEEIANECDLAISILSTDGVS